MQPFAIGSMLREAIVIAFRHWALAVGTVAVLGVVYLGNMVLIARCVLSPACLPNHLYQDVLSNFDEVVWGVSRVATWFICGLAMQRLLSSDRGKENRIGAEIRTFRGYGRCILFLASGSAIGYATAFLLPSLLADDDLANFGIFMLRSIALIPIWAYLDARFALFTASLACGGQAQGFRASWQQLRGGRRNVILVFAIIELVAYSAVNVFPDGYAPDWLMPTARYLESLLATPKEFLQFRLFDMAAFALYVTGINLMVAGGFLAVYRREIAAQPEAYAAVFD
jgi:hypothetical protein